MDEKLKEMRKELALNLVELAKKFTQDCQKEKIPFKTCSYELIDVLTKLSFRLDENYKKLSGSEKGIMDEMCEE